MSLIFLFFDGVGLAPAGPDNPLTSADMPALQALLGGPLTIEQAQSSATQPKQEATKDERRKTEDERILRPSSFVLRPVLFKPIDATLGVAGLPQSGTGQTALLAGVNAAALHERHQPHFPPVALRPLLAERGIFRRIVAGGGRATFANPFGPGYWQAVAARRIRRSASVIAAEGAGLRFRDNDDLRAGRAVSWDVTNAAMRARDIAAPLVTPAQAGANLARLADDHDLVFYESFLPDLAGHGRLTNDDGQPTTDDRPFDTAVPEPGCPLGQGQGERPTNDEEEGAEKRWSVVGRRSSVEAQILAAMQLLDGLLGGALGAMRAEDTLLMTSDHGNVESLAAPSHTRNPVPLLAVGPAARAFEHVESIMEIADIVDQVTK